MLVVCLSHLGEPLMQTVPDLVGLQIRPLTLVTRDDGTRGGDAGQAGESENLPELHEQESLRWT